MSVSQTNPLPIPPDHPPGPVQEPSPPARVVHQPTASELAEEWRDIPGFVGYQVSSHGNLRSRWTPNGTRILTANWRPLKPYRNKTGYRHTSLFNGRHQQRLKVHRLVLIVFVGPCPPGKGACHKNDIPDDNRLSNLYWGTQKENMADMKRNGHAPDQSGSRGPRAKLTEEQVQAIRVRYRQGETQTALAREYKVAQQTISGIVTYATWQHVA